MLAVAVDLQCCGGLADDWQEDRRRVEANEIRRLGILEMSSRKVDGLVIAGDLNIVATQVPVELLEGSIKADGPHLNTARIFHLDRATDWTWDGRGTPFPSGMLDYQHP